ncbi:hypothetical protein M3Y99_00351700 [Aphelenchoides fujianensis]|nr:hypothetical protein M3Y99_00351700 [Aphelenchoides fujianensis]
MQVSAWDTLSYWGVNLSSAFLLSAAHNALYFVLGTRTPVIHFLHNFNTFVLLFVAVGRRRERGYERLEGKEKPGKNLDQWWLLGPPVLLQVLSTLLLPSRPLAEPNGQLVLLRLFDCLTTIVALKLAPKVLGVGTKNRPCWSLMVTPPFPSRAITCVVFQLPIAMGASLSWLELTHIEYDGWALGLSPFLSLVQGLHLVVLKNSIRQIRSGARSFEQFAMWYVGLVSAFLALPALISYSNTVVSYDASWESIDYLLMSMSMIFAAVFKYSELWLIAHVELKDYLVLEHSKFFLASCGQWFLQNMAHATVYAACGKAIFVASGLRYWSLVRERSRQNDL